MIQGAGFRVSGRVSRRPFVVSSGKVAFVSITVEADGRKSLLDLKAFEDMVTEVGSLTEGQDVEVTGRISSEKVTDKSKNVIQKDGRDLFVPTLVIKAVKTFAKKAASIPADVDF